ncbi:MAG: hypothetical protein IPG69_18730 [Flavobacteriales bacterium]|nr:hypothetical protein [Flavobacteriales bacterium]
MVTFTTPADLQWLLIRTGWAASYFDLFQGDIAMTAIGALTPILTCAYGGGNIYPFLCNELLPNTTYTLHILYDQAFVGADGYSITAKTSPFTNAVQPTTAEVTAPNQFGMIVPSSLGATSTQSDVLACNAYLTNNACGTLNTVPAHHYGLHGRLSPGLLLHLFARLRSERGDRCEQHIHRYPTSADALVR